MGWEGIREIGGSAARPCMLKKRHAPDSAQVEVNVSATETKVKIIHLNRPVLAWTRGDGAVDRRLRKGKKSF